MKWNALPPRDTWGDTRPRRTVLPCAEQSRLQGQKWGQGSSQGLPHDQAEDVLTGVGSGLASRFTLQRGPKQFPGIETGCGEGPELTVLTFRARGVTHFPYHMSEAWKSSLVSCTQARVPGLNTTPQRRSHSRGDKLNKYACNEYTIHNLTETKFRGESAQAT